MSEPKAAFVKTGRIRSRIMPLGLRPAPGATAQICERFFTLSLKIPKLRRQTFETAIIERYRRRESSVEQALIEMYLAGVSVRRVEDITEALRGTRVSPSTVSNLNKRTTARSRPGGTSRSRANILSLSRRHRALAGC